MPFFMYSTLYTSPYSSTQSFLLQLSTPFCTLQLFCIPYRPDQLLYNPYFYFKFTVEFILHGSVAVYFITSMFTIWYRQSNIVSHTLHTEYTRKLVYTLDHWPLYSFVYFIVQCIFIVCSLYNSMVNSILLRSYQSYSILDFSF